MASTTTTIAPVKRACDSCHRRKVKCIGEGTSPCKNCVSAGLACTYNAIPQKKGPKGSRAKVLSELRENQRNAQLASGFPQELGHDGRPLSSQNVRTPGLLPLALVESCMEFFFINVYPSQPVLNRRRAQEAVVNMDRSIEAYSMIVALCAYVIIHANMEIQPNLLERHEMAQMNNVQFGHILLEESVRVRRGYDYRENPTPFTVLTSWLYHGCYFGLAKENTAWTYLREATTQAQLLGMHDEETYKHDPLDSSRKRVLYWLLFMAERTHAIHKRRPITLHPSIHLPTLDDVPSDRPVAVGLELMINLYKTIDDTFVNLWNRVHGHTNPQWMAQLQTQLSEAVPAYLECTEAQAVEIRVTQQWLRAMVWQLCLNHGVVASVSQDTSMTFKFPIQISRDLLTMTHQFSQPAMEVHGVGLIEKLFDIACCLTDVVACTSFSPDAFALGPRDYVSRFLTLIQTLRGGQSRYLPLLLAKLQEVLPNLPLPRSLNLPQTLPTSSIGLSGGMVPSNAGDEYSALPSVISPPYPSTELIRRLATQSGAQLPFSTSQQPMVPAPSSHIEDMSIYDSTHSTSHSSGSAPRSNSATPGPYEPSMSQARAQIVGHPSAQLPTTLPQHTHLQSHNIGVNPTAYDHRFNVQGFPVDPAMMFKQ
ncbi:C6 zinc finger domain-containing protein [Didymella exigua CBS 183.55]|uniref:C6 zinc finger domain-containing protein n=1 Tax=Didymella exigua CBS 183.55 TaxID=1150837 RepID=A0A6A5S068_9PLEO|nr:C6 zinc finger domain-containing protein [Didymella exigua CBS 183.55]KAF1934071.1 C6 zinc finger domain-containing protein [Didymella exigua CBS 183.55]